jgi:hypothetical protein
MSNPTVIVEISPAGTVKIDAQNFTGGACARATAPLEVVLGGAGPQKKKKKPEFFASPGIKNQNKLTF